MAKRQIDEVEDIDAISVDMEKLDALLTVCAIAAAHCNAEAQPSVGLAIHQARGLARRINERVERLSSAVLA